MQIAHSLSLIHILLVVGPYYCNPTQEGIYEHFKAIAESTNLPILLYNIPIFTNLNIKPETVGRLSKIPNIVGIKDEAGLNPTQMTEYRLSTYPEFVIYNGDDIMILCGLCLLYTSVYRNPFLRRIGRTNVLFQVEAYRKRLLLPKEGHGILMLR